MTPVLILCGALLTCLACLCWGLILFDRLELRLYQQEVYPLALFVGAVIQSAVLFVLCACGMAYEFTLAAAAVAPIAWYCTRPGRSYKRERLLPVPLFWSVGLTAGMIGFGTYYLATAMAPEVSPDGSTYHLGLVAQYLRQHGFGRITTNMYASMPKGIEMLFLNAFSVGGHSAAATVHLFLLVGLALALVQFGRRCGDGRAGIIAALLVFLSPIFAVTGSAAYVDAGTAGVVFAMFAFLYIWADQQDPRLLIPAGLLAGFAYACKLTAFVAPVYAVGFVAYTCMRRHRDVVKPALLVGMAAAAVISPWLIKNIATVGNPFSPFLNEFFPNPHVRISSMSEYSSYLRHYDAVSHPFQIPAEVTIHGFALQGLLGPVFLLSPLAVLALRSWLGRAALTAGLVFLLPYPANIGTRFLMTPAPFLALALGLVVTRWRGLGPIVLLFHGVTAMPPVMSLYAHPHAWRLQEWRWRPALRIEPEDAFLVRRCDPCVAARMIDTRVPANAKVLYTAGVAQAYSSRDLLSYYEGGLNNVVDDIWSVPLREEIQPTRLWTFDLSSTETRRLRLVQTRKSSDVWSAFELRIFDGAIQILPLGSEWKVRSEPNSWDAPLLIDRSFATRWRAWQGSEPGMWFELDIGREKPISRLEVVVSPDQAQLSARVEAELDGSWITVGNSPVTTVIPPPADLRRTSAASIKARGITHLAVHDDDFRSGDMKSNPTAWGVRLVGEAGPVKLYKLD